MNDEKLYQLCKKYGAQARLWRQKFIGLLPEVARRRLYEKKGFSSIFELAAKLAGVSAEQVRNALNLDQQFEDKPVLKKLLVNGEVSINKLIRITSVATHENQEFWANQVQILPKSALETLVSDEKILAAQKLEQDFEQMLMMNSGQEVENKNGLQKPLFADLELPGQLHSSQKVAHGSKEISQNPQKSFKILNLNLNKENLDELLELQQKGIDINQLIGEMLQKRRNEIAEEKVQISADIVQEKQQIAHEITTKNTDKMDGMNEKTSVPSRYIPVKIKKLLTKEYGEKCSIPTCTKLAEQIHHMQRFALAHTHDPKYLAPLCKQHHQIAHLIDLQYQYMKMMPRS